jgi:non-ribosomal peptide synthetase component E (peptide arylation enzyme)
MSERLANYKQVRRWFRLTALPRNALGKVQKKRLAQSLIFAAKNSE